MQEQLSLVYTSVSTIEEARQLATRALESKLAVCANITANGESMYWFENKLHTNHECYVLFKTTPTNLVALEALLIAHHPYGLPAIIQLNAQTTIEFGQYLNENVKKQCHEIIQTTDVTQLDAYLRVELREYNRPFLGQYQRHNVGFSIMENKTLVAGLTGFWIAPHQVMRIELIWVTEALRHQGLGYRLLTQLENYAKSKACKQIQASAGSWQNPGFFKKMGYEVIGIIPNWFCEHDEIFFVKQL